MEKHGANATFPSAKKDNLEVKEGENKIEKRQENNDKLELENRKFRFTEAVFKKQPPKKMAGLYFDEHKKILENLYYGTIKGHDDIFRYKEKLFDEKCKAFMSRTCYCGAKLEYKAQAWVCSGGGELYGSEHGHFFAYSLTPNMSRPEWFIGEGWCEGIFEVMGFIGVTVEDLYRWYLDNGFEDPRWRMGKRTYQKTWEEKLLEDELTIGFEDEFEVRKNIRVLWRKEDGERGSEKVPYVIEDKKRVLWAAASDKMSVVRELMSIIFEGDGREIVEIEL